jgi:SAM-dependent methyltransferase
VAYLFTDERIVTYEGSQEDPLAIRDKIVDLKRKFDIIIDDGSHRHDHQQKTLSALFKFLKPGGLYIIEDLHCAFYPEYGLDADDPDTTLNFLTRCSENGILTSMFFTRQQIGALRRMIRACKIYDFPRAHNRGGKSIVGILSRK